MINHYIDFGSDKTILLTGCIHGNEPASEFTLRDFAKHLIDGGNFEPSLSAIYKFNYHIFPRVNPTSFRTDPENIDINRDVN
jgi:hypothetical protein